jgi:hypothetical protein
MIETKRCTRKKTEPLRNYLKERKNGDSKTTRCGSQEYKKGGGCGQKKENHSEFAIASPDRIG